MGNSPHTPSIHILDDDSLINVFFLYRSVIFDGYECDEVCIIGERGWNRERWWYKLAQVCQRWRKLILGLPSYLSLCLFCTYGTPVADMLAYSPPLPLVIDFFLGDWANSAEDEERVVLALEQRHRIRRIRFRMPVPYMRKLIAAIEKEYPALEYLIMVPVPADKNTALILPETLQAPQLRHLELRCFALPLGCRLLTTVVGIVSLRLSIDHRSAYFQPNTLVQRISLMPQLETLVILFFIPILWNPNHVMERELMHMTIVTRVTLPNLHWFEIKGVSDYIEAVVRRITTPRLERLVIQLPNQPTFSFPCLLKFMNATENLKFDGAKFQFSRNRVSVVLYPPQGPGMFALSICGYCYRLDWQVSSVAQIFNLNSQISSMEKHLTLLHEVHSRSSEEHNEVNRTEWRKLLRSFSNVKTLRVDDGLVKELSRCLRPEDGELPLELLPKLQELAYFGSDNTKITHCTHARCRLA